MMKNQKGITLIALVITIIVLLILAAVSIAMLTGPNGLLTQASEAGDKTIKAEIVERINLALDVCYAEIMNDQTVKATDIPDVDNTTAKKPTDNGEFTVAGLPFDPTGEISKVEGNAVITINYKDTEAGIDLTGSIVTEDNGKTFTIEKLELPE